MFSDYSTLIRVTIQLAALLTASLWMAGVWWVFRDARRRLDDWVLVACATAGAAIFGVVAIIVYQLLRPIETLADVRERESFVRIAALAPRECPQCGSAVAPAFRACPHCAAALKTTCPDCASLVGLDWRFCATCTAPLLPPDRPPQPEHDRAPAPAPVARPARGPRTVYHARPWRRLVHLS